MTTRSIADPLAESHMRMANELLDLLAENKELKAELARRDAYQSVVTSVVNEAFAAEALDVEADAFNLPAFPVAFPNRFPIYDKWSDVPDGVTYESVDEGSAAHWVNRNGSRMVVDRWTGDPLWETVSRNSEEQMDELAPFVEVK